MSDITNLKSLNTVADGAKILRINLQIVEKIEETVFKVSDGEQEAILTFSSLSMAKSMKIGHYFNFRMLVKSSDGKLKFENSLFVPMKPPNASEESRSQSEAEDRSSYLDIKSLCGAPPNNFYYQKLLGKIVKIENKTTPTGKKVVEMTISDAQQHTHLSIWENQASHFRNFLVGDVIELQNFVTSAYPFGENVPKNLTWDNKRGSRIRKVSTPLIVSEFQSVSIQSVERVIEGTIDMFTSLRCYVACRKCFRKVLSGERCRKMCYGSESDETTTFIDFSCFLSINDGHDSWTPIRTFRNQIRDFEDPTVSLSLDFDSNDELVKKLFIKIFEKMVKIKYKVDRSGEGEDKLLTLELI